MRCGRNGIREKPLAPPETLLSINFCVFLGFLFLFSQSSLATKKKAGLKRPVNILNKTANSEQWQQVSRNRGRATAWQKFYNNAQDIWSVSERG